MGLARLSLYLIGIAAGVAAIITYRNRPAAARARSDGRFPVQTAAENPKVSRVESGKRGRG
jgi:hypothetical protein